jgi:hypothetical protein
MSLAQNEAGEAAIAYNEEHGAGGVVRFSSNGQPFGSPQTIIAGPCPETVRLRVKSEHCGGIGTLVGARDRTFFAVSWLSVVLQHYAGQVPPRLTLGHVTMQLGRFEERPVTIGLSRLGRRELTKRGTLHMRLLTRTTGTYGPALETTYPLTVLGAHRG